MDNVPNEYRCPISMELMTDPVLCEDGQTYDRRSIQEWLKHSQTSPLTRQPLNPNSLRPNYGLKASIERWQQTKRQEQIYSTYPYQGQPSYQPPSYQPPSYVYSAPSAPPFTQATTTIVPNQNNNEQNKRAIRIICLSFGVLLIIVILSSILSSHNNNNTTRSDDDYN
jgi:hypothetical protein